MVERSTPLTEAAITELRASHEDCPCEGDGFCEWFGWTTVAPLLDSHEFLRAELSRVRAERDEYRDVNESVRVCANHTREVVDGDGCLVCDLEGAEGLVVRQREALRQADALLDLALLALAVWCPHGGDSRRTGDYAAAEEARKAITEAREVLSLPHTPEPEEKK